MTYILPLLFQFPRRFWFARGTTTSAGRWSRLKGDHRMQLMLVMVIIDLVTYLFI